MTLATANAYAASLASTLMVAIIIFRAGDGTIRRYPDSVFCLTAVTFAAHDQR